MNKLFCRVVVPFLFIFSALTDLLAQPGWKKETSKDGSIAVLSRITKDADSGIPLIEYKATVQANVRYEDCIVVMKSFSRHSEIFDDTPLTKKVADISENEWILYYFIDAPWPMPNSDCVVQLSFEEDKEKKTCIFKAIAAPDKYEMKEVKRMTVSETIYSFRTNSNNTVTIEVTGEFSPVVSVPTWLLNSWTPEGPAGIVEGIIKLASE